MPVVRRFDQAHRRRGSPQVFVRSRLRRASFLQPAIKAVARKILAAAGEPGAELSLDLVGDRRMRRLNQEYRGRDLPTDVLAFPMREARRVVASVACRVGRDRRRPLDARDATDAMTRRASSVAPMMLGDVVISLHTAARHAAADGHAVDHELATLLIHGILHLVGYDHERGEREARRMRRKERAILRSLIPIPKLIAGSK
jgi:rRNA maturation RNase YbeY